MLARTYFSSSSLSSSLIINKEITLYAFISGLGLLNSVLCVSKRRISLGSLVWSCI